MKYFCWNLERDLRFSFLNQPSCPFPFLAQVSESECCFTCLPHLCMCCTDSFCCLKWSAVGFPWASLWGGGVFSRKDCMLLIMLNLFSIFKSLSCYSEFVLVEGFFTWWCGKYWLSSWTRIAFSSAFFLKFLSPSFSPREGSKVLCILVVIVYCLPSKPWSDSTNITMVNTLHRLLDAMVIQLWWQWAGVILSVGPQVISFISFFGGLVTWDKLVVYETGY